MTPEQKKLVQQSFAKVLPIKGQAAELFYGRLFELDPSLRVMFTGDMKRQGEMLMSVLAMAVNGLDRLHAIIPAVEALGRRHLNYGVRGEHYDTVGDALLWTLEMGLGDAFTPETRNAWAACYRMLAGVMQDAAAEQAA